MSPSKSTSRRQGRKGDRPSERSRSANLRADEQKSHIRPNPWVSGHNITKPVWRTWGMVNAAVVQGRIMFLPGEICSTLRPPVVGAPPVVIFEVIGQKSADGIVVDSKLMKRRPEAKRGNFPLCSILSLSRPAHVRVLRRGDGSEIFKVNQNGSFWLACPATARHSWQPPGADPHAGWCGREGD